MKDAEPVLLFMVGEHSRQIETGQHVAVEYEERTLEMLLDIAQRAGGAERSFLYDVGEFHAEARAVAEVFGDGFREVAGGEDDVVDAGVVQARERAL